MVERRAPTIAKVQAIVGATKLNELSPPNGAVDFNRQEAIALVIENRTNDPSSPVNGQIWLRTDL